MYTCIYIPKITRINSECFFPYLTREEDLSLRKNPKKIPLIYHMINKRLYLFTSNIPNNYSLKKKAIQTDRIWNGSTCYVL